MQAHPPDKTDLAQRWFEYMKSGQFTAAWAIADSLLQEREHLSCGQLPRHLQWVWRGEPGVGKDVLIHCYHGLGDTIQFIRYAPLLRQLARRVDVWVQPELIPLLGTMTEAFDELIPLDDGAPPDGYHSHVEVMELPHLFRTTLKTIPARVPYFHPRRSILPCNSKLNVGLVWQAGEWDRRRSIELGLIREMMSPVPVNWHILQRGQAYEEWNGFFGYDSGSDSVLELAQVIKALDLVITVDSMPAHLGGALGVPTWVMLPRAADWRWMEGRADSPWYPSIRLFRQWEAENWLPVLEEIYQALAMIAKPHIEGTSTNFK